MRIEADAAAGPSVTPSDDIMVEAVPPDDMMIVGPSSSAAGPLIILDWDDTLLPSSWLSREGQRLDGEQVPVSVLSRLSTYESEAITLLETVLRVAHRVIIITNAEDGWVQRSSERYTPRLAAFLRHLHVISARSRFESSAPGNPLHWKMNAFAEVVDEYVRFSGSTATVFSVGDSMIERDAVHLAASRHSLIIKSIKLEEKPNPEYLAEELRVLHESIDHLLSHPHHLDLVLINPDSNPECTA